MHKKLKIKFPITAIELERIIRTHCEHHGVWDDCIIEPLEETDNNKK